MLGEKGLFEFLKEENTQTFKELGVKKIVTLSPHSYNALKNTIQMNLRYSITRNSFEI